MNEKLSKAEDAVKSGYKKLKELLKLVIKRFGDPYYQGVASQLAFFMFLSIIPILVICSHVLGLFDLSAEKIEEWANITIEDTILSQIMETRPSGANTILLAFISVWAASRLQFNLIKATNYTLTDAAYIGKGFMRERTRAIVSTLLTLIAIVIALVVMVYGRTIINMIINEWEFADIELSGFVNTMLNWLSWPVALIVFALLVLFAFHNLPSEKIRYADLIPGAVAASFGLLALTGIYSLYTKYIVNFNILYGTFSSLIALMFFFWFTAWVILGGIVFNRCWWALRRDNPIPIGETVIERQNPMKIL